MTGQAKRALHAFAAIAAGIAIVVGIDAASGFACGVSDAQAALRTSGAQAGATEDLRADEDGEESRIIGMLSGGLPDDSATAPLKGERVGKSAVPSWFSRELWLPDEAEDIRTSEAEDVVGCTVRDSPGAASVLEDIRDRLGERGWVEHPTGVEGCSVFTKGDGACRWAMVSCIRVGDATSIVIRTLTD